jgi:hypothetical protein
MLTLVTQLNAKTANGSYKYIVQCDCGESKVVAYYAVARGNTKSCGCQQYPKGNLSPNWKHGLANKNHPLNKKYQREAFDRFKYGLEPENKQALLEKQNYGCAICGYKFGQKKGDIKVDHCHTKGNVRGLLCGKCNRGLGLFYDNLDLLEKAKDYLIKYANAR